MFRFIITAIISGLVISLASHFIGIKYVEDVTFMQKNLYLVVLLVCGAALWDAVLKMKS